MKTDKVLNYKEILEKANSKIFPEGTPECLKTHIFKLNKPELNDLLDNLELLEALKQRWQQEEWCQGIELSAESLNSLFKYNKDLFNKNLELDKKLEAEVEDSADAICKALTERDKLLDENIELQIEIRDLKEKNEILNHNSTNIVMTDTKIMKRNLELQTENQELRDRLYKVQYLEEENSKIFGKNQKLEQAISILKKKRIDVDELLSYETLEEFNDGYYKKWQLTQEEYDLLKEVFGE